MEESTAHELRQTIKRLRELDEAHELLSFFDAAMKQGPEYRILGQIYFARYNPTKTLGPEEIGAAYLQDMKEAIERVEKANQLDTVQQTLQMLAIITAQHSRK